jgi:hypothetical protein
MAERTWKIRDGQPDGSWGPEREVTLAQYRAEIAAAAEHALAIHRANAALLRSARA